MISSAIEAACSGPRDTLEHARELLLRHRLQGVPVLDEGRRLLGFLSQEDLLRQSGWGARLRALVPGAAPRVEDAMHRIVAVLDAAAPLARLVPLLSDEGHHQVAITGEGGAVVGVVGRSDLLAALCERQLETAA